MMIFTSRILRSWRTSFLLLVVVATTTRLVQAAEESTTAPPAFFLQDPKDSLCLAGEEFKRCSIDSLFYVVGNAGNYQIHKRPLDGKVDAEEDGTCIAKKSCKEGDATKVMEVKLSKCSHCGAKNWNILGDADTGYVLTEGDGKTCLIREKGSTKAMTAPCDTPELTYTPLQLHFASATDIKAMSSPGARMIGAASDGDKKTIQALLKDGVEVNVRDWDDLTALIPAAAGGHLEVCKLLVKEGIDVNAKDKDGITALMEASIMGQTKVVEFLIANGAEVDAKASSEVTALWLAASEGKTDVMKLLLKNGADASNARTDGVTALMTASVGGHVEAVKILLENGANPIATDGDGLTPFMNAAENGTVPILKLLAEHVGEPKYVNAVSNTGFTALIIAAAHGHTAAVEYLLEAGADSSVVAEGKVYPLMYASASNHTDVVRVLIEKGKADLEARHTNGGTALLEACTSGAVNAIKLLLEKGAQVDIADEDGVSPLMAIASQGNVEGLNLILEALSAKMPGQQLTDHINVLSFSGGSSVMFAAAGGHAEAAQRLIDLGANVQASAKATPEYLKKLEGMIAEGKVQDDDRHVDGVTGLHVAAQGGHLACVRVFLQAGANPNVADEEKRTPLMLAVKGNYGEVSYALVEAGADPNTVFVDAEGKSHNLLFDSLLVENAKFAKLLIEKGADVNFKDEKKVSTLLQASHRGLPEIVQMLIDKGAALEDASEEGVNPLIAASSQGHVEVVKLLLAAKANVNAKDEDETSALMSAAARGNVEVVQELIKAGANLNDQNKDGHTALMFAYNGKNQVETLWERYNQYVKESTTEQKSASEEPDDGGTGPVIRKALEEHLALVDLLLKSGADPKVKDKEGHTAKDFDFNPDADAEVLEQQAKAEKIRDDSKNEL